VSVHNVIACIAMQPVLSITTPDTIIAAATPNLVITVISLQTIVASYAKDGVVAASSPDEVVFPVPQKVSLSFVPIIILSKFSTARPQKSPL
jgi:hypothetical protein